MSLLNNNGEELPRAIVSAILFKNVDRKHLFYLQTRWKPTISPIYSGMVEVPAGCIYSYENVYDALRREVKEETNLDIVRIVGDYQGEVIQPRHGDKAFVFKPFICQQTLETNGGLPWIGFVFLCEVEGEVNTDNTEAKNPRWVSIEDLKQIVENEAEHIFPLQLPVLKYVVDNCEYINSDL